MARWLWCLALFALVERGHNTWGQVDQEHWLLAGPDGFEFTGVDLAFDIQQEFVPARNALDTVELSVARGFALPAPRNPLSLGVAVREGGFNGAVLGTSEPVDLPASFRGTALFKFSSPLTLVPGST